jgi:hypothetical protein
VNDASLGVCKKGLFHFQVEDVKFSLESEGDKTIIPEVILSMKVLAGEHDSEIGKSMRHAIRLMTPCNWKDFSEGMEPLEDKDRKAIVCLLFGFGVIGDEAFGQESFTITQEMYERLRGTNAICQVSTRPNKNDKDKPFYIVYNNNVWPCNHAKVEDVPKDPNTVLMSTPVDAGDDADDV